MSFNETFPTSETTGAKIDAMDPAKALPSVIKQLKFATWKEASQDYTAQYDIVNKTQQALKHELRMLQHMKPRLHHTMNLVVKSSPELVNAEVKARIIDKYEQEVIGLSNKMLENVYEFVEMEAKVLKHFEKNRGEDFAKGFLVRLLRVVEDAQEALSQKFGGLAMAVDPERDPWMEYEEKANAEEQIVGTGKEVEADDSAWLNASLKGDAEDKIAELEREHRVARWENIEESEHVGVKVKELRDSRASGSFSSEKDVTEQITTQGNNGTVIQREHTLITVLHTSKTKTSKPWVSTHNLAEEVKIESTTSERTQLITKKEETATSAILTTKEVDGGLFSLGLDLDRAHREAIEFSEVVDQYSSEDNDCDETGVALA